MAYLTILVPLGAGLGAAAATATRIRWAVPLAAVMLILVGLGNLARRVGGERQPSLTPVRLEAETLHPRTVLTNTPVVLYYLRSFSPVFDRPYNLGLGRARTCNRPCLIVDDTRVHGGTPRSVTGTTSMIGPYLLIDER
jgi:hypothetical protein